MDSKVKIIKLLMVGFSQPDVDEISAQGCKRFDVKSVSQSEVLEVLRHHDFSVVAVDHASCGDEFCQVVRMAVDSNPLMPVIVSVDAKCNCDDELSLFKSGAKYILRKPMCSKVFVAVANNLIQNYLQHRTRASIMQRLSATKELLESIFNNNSDIVFVRDLEGEFITTNRAFSEFFGDEVKQRPFPECLYEESLPLFNAAEKKTIETGQLVEENICFAGEKGIRQFKTKFFPLYNNDTDLYGVCVIADDITERMKLEEEKRVMSLFPEVNPNLVMRVDLSGNIIYKNPATKHWLSDRHMVDVGIYHLLPEDFTAILHRSVKEQKTFTSEVIYEDQIFEFKLTPFQELDSCLVMLADVTEREQAKRETEIYYQAFNSANQGVIITDAKGVVTQVNSAFLRIFSTSVIDVLGGTIDSFIPDKDYCLNLGISSDEYDAIFAEIKDCLSDLELGCWEGDVPALGPRKEIIWIHLFISVVRDKDGKPIAYVGMPADVTERLEEERTIRLDCYRALAELAETRDNETGEHLTRMGEYCALMAAYCGLPTKYIDDLRTFAPLHDVGKVGISDNILLAERKLTNEEFDIMKLHTTMGFEILEGKPTLEMAADIAHYHHEKWNGMGYPEGLRGKEIPLCARILAVADVYDALRSKRPYKEGWPHAKAAKIIREGSGSHFDPELVDVFDALEPRFREIGDQAAEADV